MRANGLFLLVAAMLVSRQAGSVAALSSQWQSCISLFVKCCLCSYMSHALADTCDTCAGREEMKVDLLQAPWLYEKSRNTRRQRSPTVARPTKRVKTNYMAGANAPMGTGNLGYIPEGTRR